MPTGSPSPLTWNYRNDMAIDNRVATNQAPPLVGHNVVLADLALVEAVERHGSREVVEDLAELGAMAASRAEVRVFSDDGHCVHDPLIMRRALEYSKALDVVIAQHAEEPRLTVGAQAHEGEQASRLGLQGWPAAAEESIVARDCLLALHAGARLHVCHVSTTGTADVLRWAKARGTEVSAEVTPHHLLLTDERLATYDPVNFSGIDSVVVRANGGGQVLNEDQTSGAGDTIAFTVHDETAPSGQVQYVDRTGDGTGRIGVAQLPPWVSVQNAAMFW